MTRHPVARPLRVLDAPQMRAADARTIHEIGVPSLVLMENAGRECVAALAAFVVDLPSRRVVVLCGTGNNGGDGFVVARTLRQQNVEVSVVVVGAATDIRGDARINLDILRRLDMPIVEVAEAESWERQRPAVTSAGLVVDALLGTGAGRPLTGLLASVVADLNASDVMVASIDLPSGLSASSHLIVGPAVHADLTVALGAPKVPLVLPPAEATAGTVVVADIGIPHSVIDQAEGQRLYLLTRDSVRGLVSVRPADSHKGDYGRVIVVGGALGMTGAAVLAARGALRSGAGRVTVATPASVQAIVAALGAEFMTKALPETDGVCNALAVDAVLALGADVVAVGPGLGVGPPATTFVHELIARCTSTLVIDADALTACAANPEVLRGRPDRAIVITPHPGEMARLLGCSVNDVQANRLALAVEYAVAHHVYVVLKGHRTIVALPDGRAYVNPTGTPGMATGGSGDVLTGMIAAWAGQLVDPGRACQLAVYVHGAAGELASAVEGEVSMTAGDIATHIAGALQGLVAREPSLPGPP